MTRLHVATLLLAMLFGGTAAHLDWTREVIPAVVQGDDNRDGIVDEDESGWNCATMGNLICGS